MENIMASPLFYVGLDVGGTNMKAGVVDDTGRKLCADSLATEAEKGQEHGLNRMAEAIRMVIGKAGLGLDDIAAIGVATPGLMDIPAGIIIEPFNLKPWRNVPVRKYIEDVFKKPTAFQNDANAAAYGEFWAGAAKEARSMVLFTLGTGIGGGIILGDLVLEGEHSHGAELGHMKIEMTNPRRCGCGRWGCLEAYASAIAVVKRTEEALAQDQGRSTLHGVRKNHEGITAKAVFDAASAGDELARKIVEETAFYLAVGTVNMMHAIDPDMVVYAGGMIGAGEPFLERIRWHVKQMALPIPGERTEIRYGQLGGEAGFIGAAGCARLLYHRIFAR